MGIKVEFIKDEKDIEYPFLGRLKQGRTVVLFSKPSEGVILTSDDIDLEYGDYRTDFNMDCFVKLDESIKLSND